MNKLENSNESVSVFARFRPSQLEDSHIIVSDDSSTLTSSFMLIKSRETSKRGHLHSIPSSRITQTSNTTSSSKWLNPYSIQYYQAQVGVS